MSFSGTQINNTTNALRRSRGPIIFERLNPRCRPRRSQADMRKISTKLHFLSQDRGIYAPLVHPYGTRSYSTMSDLAPTTPPVHISPRASKGDTVSIDSPVVSPKTYAEPIVTRKELWSYYRKPSGCSSPFWAYSILFFPVYYNGDNVRAYYPALC